MTTESQGISGGVSNIPATTREFGRWLNERKADWPEKLQHLGARAMLSLDYLDQPSKNRSANLDELARKDLMVFAAAFGEWKSNP